MQVSFMKIKLRGSRLAKAEQKLQEEKEGISYKKPKPKQTETPNTMDKFREGPFLWRFWSFI